MAARSTGRQPHQVPVPSRTLHIGSGTLHAQDIVPASEIWDKSGTRTSKKTKGSAGINQLTPSFMAPRPGLEPGTYGLTEQLPGRSSELSRRFQRRFPVAHPFRLLDRTNSELKRPTIGNTGKRRRQINGLACRDPNFSGSTLDNHLCVGRRRPSCCDEPGATTGCNAP